MTEPIRRAVPSQSRDAKPERRDLCVGGMGGVGRKTETITPQKITTGSYSLVNGVTLLVQVTATAYLNPKGPMPPEPIG